MQVRSLDTDTVTSLVADATTAPSMHNAQPWLFRYVRGSGVLRMRMDPARAMPHADPDHRALHVGCGAALFNLRVAAARAGWEAGVTLLPDPADPELLADVVFGKPVAPDDRLADLHPVLRKRRTNRFPFTEEAVPQAVRDELSGAALAEGARLVFLDAWQTEAVLRLVRDAEAEEAADPRKRAEVARWTWRAESADAPGRAEGIPSYALGPRSHGGGRRSGTSRRRSGPRGAARRCSSRCRAWRCWAPGRTVPRTGCTPVRPWSGCCSRPRWTASRRR